MIVRAKFVVTMTGAPIDNGALAISGERISAVGKFSDLRKKHAHEEIVDLGERAVLPGLINAHCHLDYTCLRGSIPPRESFTDWIRAINAAKAQLTMEDYVRSIDDGFAEAKRFGTTTIVNLTAFPEVLSRVQPPIRTWWFPELIDVRERITAENLNAQCIQVSERAKHWGLAPHAPFTASSDLYRTCETIAERENILLTTHLAESKEEMAMFREAKGALYGFLKGIGRDMTDCGNVTPIEAVLRRIGSANRPYLFAHLNEISEHDFDRLKKSASAASIAHCPRSRRYFDHSPFQFERLRELGMNVCLGTDSLASNEDLSLFAEMRAFQTEFPDVSAESILGMVTRNPAGSLGQTDALGKIAPGFFADLIAVPATSSATIFDEIIAFEAAVGWLMIGGRVLA